MPGGHNRVWVVNAQLQFARECGLLACVRKTMRWRSIKVRYQNDQFQTRLQTFTDWTAQIIQHEMDHCNGVLI